MIYVDYSMTMVGWFVLNVRSRSINGVYPATVVLIFIGFIIILFGFMNSTLCQI